MFLIAMVAAALTTALPVPRLMAGQFSIAALPAPPVIAAARTIARSTTPAPVSVDCIVMRRTGSPASCLPTDRAALLPTSASGPDYELAQRGLSASDSDAWAVRLAYAYQLRFAASVPIRDDIPGVVVRFTVILQAAPSAQPDGPTLETHEIMWQPVDAPREARFPAFALAMELVTKVSATCRIEADLHPFCHDAMIVERTEAGGATTPLTPFQEWQLYDAMYANVYPLRAAPLTRSGLSAVGHTVVLRASFRLPN